MGTGENHDDSGPPFELYELTIPDELLAWAQQPEVARSMRVPWGRLLERTIRNADRQALGPRHAESLLCLLEPIVSAAVSAGRADLLVGLDTLTADLMKLTFIVGDKTVGAKGEWSFEEVQLVQATDNPPSALAFVEQMKNLVADVFPGARVDAVGRTQALTCRTCRGPVEEGVVVEMGEGLDQCLRCWVEETRATSRAAASVEAPKKPSKPRKKKGTPEPEVVTDQLGLYEDDDWE